MKHYEIVIERITPCGGTKYAVRDIEEADTDSPEAYVRENGRFPMTQLQEDGQQTVIVNSNKAGYRDIWYFTELED